jgi:hypothetical protein
LVSLISLCNSFFIESSEKSPNPFPLTSQFWECSRWVSPTWFHTSVRCILPTACSFLQWPPFQRLWASPTTQWPPKPITRQYDLQQKVSSN